MVKMVRAGSVVLVLLGMGALFTATGLVLDAAGVVPFGSSLARSIAFWRGDLTYELVLAAALTFFGGSLTFVYRGYLVRSGRGGR